MPAESKQLEFISAEEAAKELKTTVLNVLMHLKRKRLVGHEIDGTWQISRKSLLDLGQPGQGRVVLEQCGSSCAKKAGCGSCG